MSGTRQKATVVYRLKIAPDESAGEGEDCDEWFTSLEAAKWRRGILITGNPNGDGCRYLQDYAIERVEIDPLPRRQLIIALLEHRIGGSARQVVSPYVFPAAARGEGT